MANITGQDGNTIQWNAADTTEEARFYWGGGGGGGGGMIMTEKQYVPTIARTVHCFSLLDYI